MKPLLKCYLSAFKQKDFDFIVKSEDKYHIKQEQALKLLVDNETVELLYGGAAGGAKSWTGATWLTFMALSYPETNWFAGREALIDLRESTMMTFNKVFKKYGITDEDVKYNGQDHFYQFSNGSQIRLISLQYMPSDPLYERYGSKEFTGGWIEEAGQVHHSAYDILKTRIGRCNNDKYGLLRKLFITANPKKNWLYTDFYNPSKKDQLKKGQKFLPCLVTDNPFIEADYINALESTSNEANLQRLRYGNWDYESNPNALISSESIMEFIQGTDEFVDTKQRYVTADIAMQGSDLFVVIVWDGWTVLDVKYYDKSDSNKIEYEITVACHKWGVPFENVCYDSDGLGNFLRGKFKESIGFNNGAAAITTDEMQKEIDAAARQGVKKINPYASLKTQCAYLLADKFKNKTITRLSTAKLSKEAEEKIIQELGMIQSWKIDDEKKLYIMPKEEIKQIIGRSPDFADAFIMRSMFELVKNENKYLKLLKERKKQ